MNTQQQTSFQPGFPPGYCPQGSAIDDCPPVTNNANLTKSFLYTVLAFAALCLVSYLINA